MKVPKATRLPSGAWNVRVMVDGKSVSITKPTEKEAIAAAMQIKARKEDGRKHTPKTVSQAIDDYISARENVLSPSTIRGYRIIQRTRFLPYSGKRIGEMTAEGWQRAVNSEAKLCSAKTLRNAWLFLSSVITNATGQKVSVRLPQVIQNDLPFLTAEQVPVFLDAIKGTPCEITALLALSSLRKSEILALRWEDIDIERGCIYVRGAAVQNEDGVIVRKKETKNTTSRRTIPFLLPQLRDAVVAADKSADLVASWTFNTACRQINRACHEAGLPSIGLHGLRRSFASLAYHIGMSEEVAMKTGGWADIYTMRKIYTKVSEADIAKQGKEYESFFSNLQ